MRRRDSALCLVFKITHRLEFSWRPLHGRLTLVSLILGCTGFVDGIYIPADMSQPREPGDEASAA